AQTLLKRIDKKGGRCAALEILIVTHATANLIRESKTYQLPSVIQTGKKYGMQSLDDAILELLNKRWIDPEEAYDKCIEKERFIPHLKRIPDEFA
ncbi:MAG: type IV pili twitching motility protein PilT, partial [Nitrospinae bacterium]|nr:type IV pili twitching motility protein PilT [Nitrospinota bacterium]